MRSHLHLQLRIRSNMLVCKPQRKGGSWRHKESTAWCRDNCCFSVSLRILRSPSGQGGCWKSDAMRICSLRMTLRNGITSGNRAMRKRSIKKQREKNASLGLVFVLKVGEKPDISHSCILFLLSLCYRGKITSAHDLWLLPECVGSCIHH